MMNSWLRFGLIGALAGLLSYGAIVLAPEGTTARTIALQWAPGVIFALALLLAATSGLRHQFFATNALMWIIGSTVSYFIAFQIALRFIGTNGTSIALFAAGLIGGALMLLSYHATLGRFSVATFVGATVWAGVLGLTYMLGQGLNVANPSLLFLLVCWQAGMAAAVGAFVRQPVAPFVYTPLPKHST